MAVDIQFGPAQRAVWSRARGMIFIKGDLFKINFAGPKFDLVVCTQV